MVFRLDGKASMCLDRPISRTNTPNGVAASIPDGATDLKPLNKQQTADRLGVGLRTLSRMMRARMSGDDSACPLWMLVSKRRVVFDVADIDAWKRLNKTAQVNQMGPKVQSDTGHADASSQGRGTAFAGGSWSSVKGASR